MLVLRLYKNQSIDLQSKSVDWFQYNPNTVLKCIKLSLHTQVELIFTYSGTFNSGTLFVFIEAAFQRCFLN